MGVASYQVLARKWRPQSFEEVIGQKHVVQTLQNALRSNRIAHAFLFAGQRGTGKTSIARILAKALNCETGPTPQPCGRCASCSEITEGNAMDVLEIDGASNTGVDDVRELRESVKYVPSKSRYKIYIIDEIHMLSQSAFNALLKTLEEPPDHVIFMCATTEPQKIPPTVLSRCQRFDLRRLSLDAVVQHLSHIAATENISISDQGLRWIARGAEGSMRDAQSILERVVSYAGEQVKNEDIAEVLGIVDRDLLMRTSQAIVDRDAKACLEIVRELFRFGYDVRQFYHAFLEHLRNLMMVKISNTPDQLTELTPSECEMLKTQVNSSEVGTLQRLFDIWMKAEEEINRSSLPQVVLEMTLLKMVYLAQLLPIDTALARLSDLEKKLTGPPPAGNTTEVTTEYPSRPSGKGKSGEAINEPPQVREDAFARSDGEGSDEQHLWEKLLELTRQEKPLLAALLDHGRLLHCDDKSIEVGFTPQSIFLESAKETDKKDQFSNICEKFFGRKMQVKISSLPQGDDHPTPHRSKTREKKSEGGGEKDAGLDPLINEALHIFNGKIVEVRSRDN